jgi:hypothetical protein
MSQYPIDDLESTIDAVNYLLSGPQSIGQNFEGMSAVGLDPVISENLFYIEVQTYLSGMPINGTAQFRTAEEQPGSVDYPADPADPNKYYPIWNTLQGGLPITAITPVLATGRDITVTVTLGTYTNESQMPFADNQQIVISGVTPSSYNGTYTVVNFDPNDIPNANVVTLRSDLSQTWATYTSGGAVRINDNFTGFTTQRFFTGDQAIVSVTGPTDRVFVSSQMNDLIVYSYTDYSDVANYTPKLQLEINRYKAVEFTTLSDVGPEALYANATNTQGVYGGYLWKFDKNIVSVASVIGATSIGLQVDANNLGDVIYNNIIDNPGIGVYLYAFQINLIDNAYRTGDLSTDDAVLLVGASTTGVRSFTAQVIKR